MKLQTLRDAAALIFLVLLLFSVRVDSIDAVIDLGSVHAAPVPEQVDTRTALPPPPDLVEPLEHGTIEFLFEAVPALSEPDPSRRLVIIEVETGELQFRSEPSDDCTPRPADLSC